MTILPTHLSLGGILLWSILTKSEKEGFSKNKLLFWIVLVFSIIPDIDIFFGVHRGFWHSLIPPSTMAIVGVYIHTYYRQKIKSASDELKQKLMKKVKEIYSDKKVIDIDGIKILFSDASWMLLRPSGTEPIFRVFVEAQTEEKAKKLMEEGLKTVKHAFSKLKN